MRLKILIPTLSLIAACSYMAGCKKAEVRIYDVAKEENTSKLQTPAGAANGNASGTVVWNKAEQWETLAPTAFRKGNYLHESDLGTVEITVSSFPGSTGGLLRNVNRWLGQAELPEISQKELLDLVQTSMVDQIPVSTVDLGGEDGGESITRIYASTLMYSGQSWFFKMSGPTKAVSAQIPAFTSMIEGLVFSESVEETPVAQETQGSGDISFTPPAGWIESTGSDLRIASFQVPKEGFEPADFSITAFPGDTGGVLANVNRWRRQIGLEPWSQAEVQANEKPLLAESGLKFRLFDLKPDLINGDSAGKERIIAAILVHSNKSWFFKLRGNVFLVDTQRNKFQALLNSVHFHQEGEKHNH